MSMSNTEKANLAVHLRLLDKRESRLDKSDNHGSTSRVDCDVD